MPPVRLRTVSGLHAVATCEATTLPRILDPTDYSAPHAAGPPPHRERPAHCGNAEAATLPRILDPTGYGAPHATGPPAHYSPHTPSGSPYPPVSGHARKCVALVTQWLTLFFSHAQLTTTTKCIITRRSPSRRRRLRSR